MPFFLPTLKDAGGVLHSSIDAMPTDNIEHTVKYRNHLLWVNGIQANLEHSQSPLSPSFTSHYWGTLQADLRLTRWAVWCLLVNWMSAVQYAVRLLSENSPLASSHSGWRAFLRDSIMLELDVCRDGERRDKGEWWRGEFNYDLL
jgi:hypothetical protein